MIWDAYDVLDRCPKSQGGMAMLVRTMAPMIAVDEIGRRTREMRH